jgi:hypothetical protein
MLVMKPGFLFLYLSVNYFKINIFLYVFIFSLLWAATSRLYASGRGFQPEKFVSSRERVTRKNEACNMLWSPGWRITALLAPRSFLFFNSLFVFFICSLLVASYEFVRMNETQREKQIFQFISQSECLFFHQVLFLQYHTRFSM